MVYYNRKSIRIRDYDYSKNGFYYVTICTQNRKEILGNITNEIVGAGLASAHYDNITVKLSKWGIIVKESIMQLQYKYDIEINNYIIMPNHVHMIIENSERADARPAPTLSEMICCFKSITAMKYLKYNKKNNICNGKLWQRNYYEHIIRNDKEYIELCKYIQENPLRYWLKNGII